MVCYRFSAACAARDSAAVEHAPEALGWKRPHVDAKAVGVGLAAGAEHDGARHQALLDAVLPLVVHRQRAVLVFLDPAGMNECPESESGPET